MEEEQKSIVDRSEENNFKKLVYAAVIIMLLGLILIALYTFFFSMQSAISVLFDDRYVPLASSIFSLVVIIIGVYLVKMFLSR